MSNEKIKWYEKFAIFKKLKNIKHIEVYIAIIFILILLGIYFIDFSKKEVANTSTIQSSSFEYANELEDKLSIVLSKIKNAGKVSVMVAVASSSETIYATITEEKNNSSSISNGSTSVVTTTTEPVIVSSGGESSPVVVKERMPEILGVIVVAEGADDISVKLELLKAVQAVLNVPTTNIEILVGNK